MAQISKEEFIKNHENALLSSTNRVEAPFVRVEMGGYTFGVYESESVGLSGNQFYKNMEEKYPNYIKQLDVKKINGTVNQYTLVIEYPITDGSDPNFFERIFSSISDTRYIKITYGDFMSPNFIYSSGYQNIAGKGEEAIITDVKTSFDMTHNSIQYVVSAVSTANLTLSGSFNFGGKYTQPSKEIYETLYNEEYHLTDVFTGMANPSVVEMNNFIATDDKKMQIPTYTNISALEYISKLVNHMAPDGTPDDSGVNNGVYTLTTYDDPSNLYGGPYFKVSKVETAITTLNKLVVYTIDVGYPTANIVTNFSLSNQSNWSIMYDYNKSVKSSDYIKRIGDDGSLEYIYSPLIRGTNLKLEEEDKSWWTKVTSFPIQASITIKGLLRPAILMTYVKLNVWFFGHKHNSSGYYIITSQEDKIDMSNGYTTTLGLTRVAGDEEFI